LLLLSVSAGAGHVRAAQAIEAAARAAQPPLAVTHLDLLTLVPKEFRKLYGEQYIKLVEKLRSSGRTCTRKRTGRAAIR
jgi:processive 1,2-diacylglycerol beta-glucosyltransferase